MYLKEKKRKKREKGGFFSFLKDIHSIFWILARPVQVVDIHGFRFPLHHHGSTVSKAEAGVVVVGLLKNPIYIEYWVQTLIPIDKS